MNNNIIKSITGKAVPIYGNDVDTDQIIPARYMKEITFENTGKYLFQDCRFDENGNPKDFPLNEDRFKSGTLLFVGKNFGCGSSREHAPQSLKRYGITGIVGESFAEIFAGNCKALGLVIMEASEKMVKKLQEQVDKAPDTIFVLDVEQKKAIYKDEAVSINMQDERRQAFLEGTWDIIATLKNNMPQIQEKHQELFYK